MHKTMAKLTEEQAQKKLYLAIKKKGKGVSAEEAVKLTGMGGAEVKAAGKALVKAGKLRFGGKNRDLLEIVPAKAETPAKSSKTTSTKTKKKAQTVEDDEDEDEDEDEEWDDEDESDEDEDEEGSDEDEDEESEDEDEDEDDPDEDEDEDEDEESEDEDEDEDDEDEDDDPPAKKSKVKSKAPAKKAPAAKGKATKAPAKSKEFTMTFKPIDTLTDKELQTRLNNGLEAAEALFDDGHKAVAELIMRALAKVKRQQSKRAAEVENDD